ncbi:MAG: S41 family peptidase [Gammaproteobacteria bacterium]|nr:S41 family peptidase [Gammaproteobacteria bacterium]
MKSMTRNSLILGLGLVLGVMLTVGQGVFAERQNTRHSSATIPLEDIRSLSEVFGKIKQNYVEEVEDKELLENAIRGLLSGLDPHSAYLDKKAFTDLREGTSGEFGGLGIVVGLEDGFVKVISPIDDTPAARAGVKSGDLVIRLDDKNVKGMSLEDAVKIMRGKPNTDITLTIVRKGEAKPLKFKITRDIIKVQSVRSRTLEKGFGYIRVSAFQERTGADLRKALSKLKKDNNKRNLKGLVLDLRNNPGGLLTQAIEVSDAFLENGVVVSIKGRDTANNMTHSAKGMDLLNNAPIVVLINGGSASASEIVAGALQDHKRAIIMGSQSFGKASVQTVVPLGNGSALKLTTARYYTPNGTSIQAKGIVPDIELDDLKVSKREDNGFKQTKEKDLSRHLDNGQEESSNGKEKDSNDIDTKLELANEDYALYEALNLLKGIHLVNEIKNR